jgi:hypothetical protein
MRTVIADHELLPKGLNLEGLSIDAGKVTLSTRSRESKALCPVCGGVSSRVHRVVTFASSPTCPGMASA